MVEYCRELLYAFAVDVLSEVLNFRLVVPFLFLIIVPSSMDSDSEISDFTVDSFCSGFVILLVDTLFELEVSVMHKKYWARRIVVALTNKSDLALDDPYHHEAL